MARATPAVGFNLDVAGRGNILQTWAGVDWLTVTAKTEAARWRFKMLSEGVLLEQEEAGNESSRQSSRWYSWLRCGSFAVGEREEDVCVQMSGSVASTHWKKFADAATGCSRIDVQVTALLGRASKDVAHDARRQLLEGPKGRGRPPEGRMVEGLRRGVTFYIGSPKSDTISRVYDKGAESDLHADGELWRWEVQYRNDPARSVLHELRRHQNAVPIIGEVVHRYYQTKGIDVGWDPKTHGCGSLQRSTERSDDAKKLRWLEQAVGPTVQYLAERGLLDEVLTRLGLASRVLDAPIKHGGT